MFEIRSYWVALAFVFFATSAYGVSVGGRAPPFTLATDAGDRISLERLRGRIVYVDFWASWCGPCRRSFPWMNDMQRRYGSQGLSIVAVNVDKKHEEAIRFLSETPAEFTIVYDAAGATPSAYAVEGMPTSYLIDQSGNVAAIEQGFREGSPASLEQKIRALIAPR